MEISALQQTGMKVEQVPIERVVPYERNPRKGGAVDKVAASLTEFGWKQPMVVDGEMVVIAGHTRLAAAKKLGMATVPVLVAKDLDPAKVKAYRIADNRSAQDATWDAELLGFELADLQALAYDLPLLGFEPDELTRYLPAAIREDEDDVPGLPEEPISKPGDLWLLGDHRLLCGDATAAADVATVLRGSACDILLTDPPYSSGGFQDGLKRHSSSIGVRTRSSTARDNLSSRGFLELIRSMLSRVDAEQSLYFHRLADVELAL
jgi:hypothetical protein